MSEQTEAKSEAPAGPPPSPTGLSRRQLVAGAATALAVVAADTLLDHPVGRWLGFGDAFVPPEPSPVALVGCDSYQRAAVRAALESAFRLAPPPEVRGKRVVLKPNFVEFHEVRPITTSVAVIRETVRMFRELGAASVVVAEGPGHRRDTEEVWAAAGLLKAAAEDGFEVIDLNVDDLGPFTMTPLFEKPGRTHSKITRLLLPRTVREADVLVSMPKLKTHHWAGFTLGMKNLFGVVPGSKYGWPKNLLHFNGIPRSIVELARSIPVRYTVVDGIEGMEGDGPIMGSGVASHCLITGRSVFAVDWAGARVMGFDPRKAEVMQLAAAGGLGKLEEPILAGEALSRLRREFAVLPAFESLRG